MSHLSHQLSRETDSLIPAGSQTDEVARQVDPEARKAEAEARKAEAAARIAEANAKVVVAQEETRQAAFQADIKKAEIKSNYAALALALLERNEITPAEAKSYLSDTQNGNLDIVF